jgi:hypothetical protein
MKMLNAELLKKFLHKACEKLNGRWLLVGGTLLPAVGLDVRSTVDIDLVGLGEREAAQDLELMELAESLDLPIEAINPAAAFFVRRAEVRNEDLLPLFKGKSATIFRPSVDLYWRLKLVRLSEADELDCQHYFQFCKGQGDAIDAKNLRQQVLKEIKNVDERAKLDRLERLLALL